MTKPHDQRRQELMDAARELFLQQGFEATSMSEIARRAEVAQGTFYLYFPSKQEVLTAIMRELFEEIFAIFLTVAERPDLSALAKLRAAMVAVIARMSQESRLVQAVYLRSNLSLPTQLLEEYNPRMLPALVSIIEQGIREGALRVRHPEIAADLLWSVGYRYFERIAKAQIAGETAGLPELEQGFWAFTMQGLGLVES
ncbi:MAG TPA: TetR/AcrR family transcriptional regulator [Symbiobacteriaceae bacterium]|nr:TetR/AcrR family transcriptional regulator [Symbiobacteriaceae bacterium]